MIRSNKLLLVSALLVVLPGFLSPPVYAKPAEVKVCPVHGKNKVKQIDIFDGDPKELAYLAPDDDASNTYTVSSVYEHGNVVTVRCKYSNGKVIDVPLTRVVDKCIFSRSKQGESSLVCKQGQ